MRSATLRSTTLISLLTMSLFAGCANQEIQRKDGTSSARSFALSNLAKSDVDIFTEITQREMLKSLRQITEKLYRRNPSEYRKTGFDSPEAAAARIFDHLANWPESPLARLNWEENFKLAFQDTYGGDRIYAFMTALTTMLMASYNHQTAFFLPDDVSAQKLYNSARNIETAVWKLSNARLVGTGGGAGGNRMVISNSMDGEVQNLSFEREFGKLIAQQDILALILEDRNNRSISRVFQNAASFVFLPI